MLAWGTNPGFMSNKPTHYLLDYGAALRWPNNSAADNAIFKNRAQNIECSFGGVARSAVLLEPNVANILLFNFCEKKIRSTWTEKNGPIMPVDQNPYQTVTRFGCVCFSM